MFSFINLIFLCCSFHVSAATLLSKKFLIVANGTETINWDLLKKDAKNRTIIALDGAHKILDKQGVKYHVLLGDCDSMDKTMDKTKLKALGRIKLVRRPDQNYTDLEKGIAFCDDLQASEIIIYNGTGDRFDHSELNRRLLKKCYKVGRPLLLRGALHTMQYITRMDSPFIIKGTQGGVCGLFAGPESVTITTQGLAWDVKHWKMEFDKNYSVSNKLLQKQATVMILDGPGLFVILPSVY